MLKITIKINNKTSDIKKLFNKNNLPISISKNKGWFKDICLLTDNFYKSKQFFELIKSQEAKNCFTIIEIDNKIY